MRFPTVSKHRWRLFHKLLTVVLVISLIIVLSLPHSVEIVDKSPVRNHQWQFPSHRDPTLQTHYLSTRFFYEDLGVLNSPEKKAVAQCYINHCTEEGSRKSGNFENYTTSRQKGCSNYDYQDVQVFSSFFMEPLQWNGVFVEIGAMTGWGASNTLFFEHCLNWTGVLFDISLDNYHQMRLNRPHTRSILGTVCREPGVVYVANSTAGCCGKVSTWQPAMANDDSAYTAIPCKPMSDWLKESGIARIDYFSLDTEGYEYRVLETIDWQYNSIRVLSVEMLDRNLIDDEEFGNQQKIRNLLSRVGLTYLPWLSVARDSLNRDEFWVNLSWI